MLATLMALISSFIWALTGVRLKLFVFLPCPPYISSVLDEARNYAIDDAGRFSDPDDHIDSARIGILALIQGHGEAVVSRANNFVFRRIDVPEGKVQRI
jgi:hypothetical protein